MNWLDILLLLILLVSVASSFRNGLSREIIGLVSVLLALLLGIWFYGIPAGWVAPYLASRSIAGFIGFVLVFCAVLAVGGAAGIAAGRVLRVTGLSFFDHLLGALFGAAKGLLIGVALVTAVMAFAKPEKPPDAIVESRMAPYVVNGARVVAAMAPHELKEGFRKTYAQVKAAWGKALEHGIRDERRI
jgi:membrane protein required for colicin V production